MKTSKLSKKEVIKNLDVDVRVNILDKEDGSTNTTARKLFLAGGSPVLVATTWQVGGRGTRGRSFYGCEGGGLYMSLALKPGFPKGYLSLATPLVAVVVANAINEVCNAQTRIKWVNDITVSDKKLCGILCESVLGEQDEPQALIVGVGINLVSENLAEDIKDIACALDDICDECDVSRLCAEIVNKIFYNFERIETKDFLESYRALSSLVGRRVKFQVGDITLRGIADRIDDEARLVVLGDDGIYHTLECGDVSVRPDEADI